MLALFSIFLYGKSLCRSIKKYFNSCLIKTKSCLQIFVPSTMHLSLTRKQIRQDLMN